MDCEMPAWAAASRGEKFPTQHHHLPQGVSRRNRRSTIQWLRWMLLFVLATVVFIAHIQWKEQLALSRIADNASGQTHSLRQLHTDWETCSKLYTKPQDSPGLGRERNERYIEGQKPTIIRNATIWVGEPGPEGYQWIIADVLLERGLIVRVAPSIPDSALPGDVITWDAQGRQLTTGIVDMHSHAGIDSLPSLSGNEDVNEKSSDITPFVRSIDGLLPLDHQIQVIKSGGVTTSLILPGSSNNIGGEAFPIKHAVGKEDGRLEISAADLLADQHRSWRYIKMACGENPKRNQFGPASRLGESWEFRHAFEQAAEFNQQQDDWCREADAVGLEKMTTYLPRSLEWELLGAVLRGQVHVNTHCYTIPDLEAFVDHTNEFEFPVRAFHHAHQSYLVPEILNRTYGGRPPASALFVDNMYFKAESYIASEYAGKFLWEAGLTPIYVSDNPVLNAQHVVFEAAKAYRHGLPYHVALAAVTSAPAELLGLGQRIGKVLPGFDADIVVWDSDPLSVGAAPVQVWIDGKAQFKDPVELLKPAQQPIVPDSTLQNIWDNKSAVEDVIFTGLSKVILPGQSTVLAEPNQALNVVVKDGSIACIGLCTTKVTEAKLSSTTEVVELRDGHLTAAFTGFGSSLGINEVDAEPVTDNGPNPHEFFSRGVDGLALANKKLEVGYEYGITRAVTAPKLRGAMTHQGTSVGFLTGASSISAPGAVWAKDTAVHYTLTQASKGDKTPSTSIAVGELRDKLFKAVQSEAKHTGSDEQLPYSETSFLRKVVREGFPLVITAQNSDIIASVLAVKSDVEDYIVTSGLSSQAKPLRFVILGGAEAHLQAAELARANVGVILAPFQSYATSWEQRRALVGAPLSDGTTVDALLRAGVTTAIGLDKDYHIRDLSLQAGIAFANSGGKITEEEALDLVSHNIYRILGLEEEEEKAAKTHFIVWEGNPFDIGSRIKAVSGGLEQVSVFSDGI